MQAQLARTINKLDGPKRRLWIHDNASSALTDPSQNEEHGRYSQLPDEQPEARVSSNALEPGYPRTALNSIELATLH